MRNTAKTFFKVGRIIAIVCIVLFAVLAVVLPIVDLVKGLKDAGNDSKAIASVWGSAIGECFGYLFSCACSVVSLIFTNIGEKGLDTAKSHEEAVKPAVFAIVGGALSAIFPIVSGILMLCMKDEDYGGAKPVETPNEEVSAVEEKPAEEPAKEEVK